MTDIMIFKKFKKRSGAAVLAAVLSLTVAATAVPVNCMGMDYAADPATDEGGTAEMTVSSESISSASADPAGVAGRNTSEAKSDSELAMLLEDPEFYDYYEIAGDGTIKVKDCSSDTPASADGAVLGDDTTADTSVEAGNAALSESTGTLRTASAGGIYTAGCVTKLGGSKVPSKYSSAKGYVAYNCIDISYWQGKISDSTWKKIKNNGISRVILRVGYSSTSNGNHNKDSVFAHNIAGAREAGLKVGAYYYSAAKTASEAKSEAKYAVSLLEDYKSKISLPVAYDYETGGRLTSSVMKKNGDESCEAFCDYIKSAGYKPMIYASRTVFENYLDYKELQDKYKIWVAQYYYSSKATDYSGKFYAWQYSSSVTNTGISGKVDCNYIFVKKKNVWGKVNGHKVYYGSDGKKVTGYHKIGNFYYGFDSNGYMYSSKTVKINGKTYRFASDGKSILKTVKTLCKLNYRTGPAISYTLKGSYAKGKTLCVTRVKDGWFRLTTGYWVNGERTELVKQYGQ